MQRKSFVAMECPIARSLEELGDAWTLLILRNALLGARRFHDFEERLGIPPNTLSRRLERLVALGFFERLRYEARPARDEYALTPKALDVLPVIVALAAWGNRWLMRDAVAIECMDPKTLRAVDPVLVDRRTGRALVAGSVALKAGPRASAALRAALQDGVVLGAGQLKRVTRKERAGGERRGAARGSVAAKREGKAMGKMTSEESKRGRRGKSGTGTGTGTGT